MPRSDSFWSWFDQEARPKLAARAKTFEMMFTHLDSFDRPVCIIETGCIEEADNWQGNGCSTIMFSQYLAAHPKSRAISLEILREKVEQAQKLCPGVIFLCGDSITLVEAIAKGFLQEKIELDLLYLDASHLHWTNVAPAAAHHLNELLVAMPMIREDTLVVVDDAPIIADDFPMAYVGGKGQYVADYANQIGATLVFSEYQVGWTGMNRKAPENDADLRGLIERARTLVESENLSAAAPIYRQILVATNPMRTGQARVARGEACAFFGKIGLLNGKHGVAAEWFRQAVAADPLATDYRLDLVQRCLLPIGHMRAARDEAERAVRVSPDYDRAWKILGGVAQEQADTKRAREAYDTAIELNPMSQDALLDRALQCLETGENEKALNLAREVVALVRMGAEENRKGDALHVMAMVAYRDHRHEEAIGLYDEAIAAGCFDAPMARWNKSLAMHSIGRLRAGWIEHEQREFTRTNPALYLPLKRFNLPRWTGQSSVIFNEEKNSKRQALIHVHYEAGSGDNIACVRYLSELTKRGFKVRYECNDEIVTLMQDSFPDVEIVPKAPDYPGALNIEPFDYHSPIGSLPAVFGTDIDTIPWDGPYIKANAEAKAAYAPKINNPRCIGAIGICWSSGIRDTGAWIKEYGQRKSMHFDTAFPLMNQAWELGFEVISLQVGPERGQLDRPTRTILDVLPAKPTWQDTAAVIANLDLVITVDTAVAHLAGAMGKKVFLMCQRDGASWHFMCWRPGAPWNDASPWYPGMRVFRQHDFDSAHRWGDVIIDVGNALHQFAIDHAAARAEA